MLCGHCQFENKENRKFCSACGAALAVRCAGCGYQNEPSDRFCGGCGKPLGERAPAQERDAAPGDRRPVAIMFCDLVGYTRLSSQLDPEEVHALLESFFAVVDAVVDRYGGVIDKHIGDAAMALFGAPRAYGDDALRAVRAAFEIQHTVSATLVSASGPLKVHIGLAIGEVVATSVGSDWRRGYTVVGEAANVAARLLDQAGAGETFVSDAIYRATVQGADYEPLGAQTLKGLENPVEIWRLAALKSAASPGGAPLIGRRVELAQCRAVLTSIAEGNSGAVVVVRGEPGIGKTRFVEEAQSLAVERGFARYSGAVLDFGTERGHGAIRTVVASLIGVARDAAPEETEAAMLAAVPAGDDVLYLRDLLEIPQREHERPLYEAIDRAARARAKARVLGRLVTEAARARPTLITVEDVHWADAETLDLLAAIALATNRAQAALVVTTRIVGDPLDVRWRAAAGDGLQLAIDLAPLPPADAETMARSFPAAETFAMKCVERAGGNPLFLEQLLRTAGDLVDGKLPSTIQSLVLARTDLLAGGDKRAIEAASVLGQRFVLANLRAMLNDANYVCDALLRNALLRPVSDGLQFVHALVRDGVYASLTRARRRQLHRSAADVFLDDPVLRAEHLDLADDSGAALAYLEASRLQESLFRQDQASALGERGLVIATAALDKIALALQVGALKLAAGRGEEALAACRAALSSGAAGADRLQALMGCAAANRMLAKLDDAFASLDDAEPAARTADDRRALAEIHYLRGNLHFARGDIALCRSEHTQALDFTRGLKSPEWRARALSGLADSQYLDCRMRTALRHFSECVDLCDAALLPRIAAPNRVMMGHCRLYLCDFDAGLDDMRRALELARRLGDGHAEMFALQSTGFGLAFAGRHAEAAPILTEALEQSRRIKARRYEAIILGATVEVALVAEGGEEARSLLHSALAVSEETSPGFVGPMLYGLLALAETSRAASESALSAGEALLEKGAVGHNHFRFRRYAIEWALREREWDAADRHSDALLQRMASEPLPYSDFVARRGRLLAAAGRGDDSGRAAGELAALRAKMLAAGLNLEALSDAVRNIRA